MRLFSELTAASLALFCLLAPAYATPISSDPGGGGVGGNAASAPGPSSDYPWVGTVDDTNTGTGNKSTTVPTISWTARGGLQVDLTLYHNSETNFPSPFGYKWLLFYESQVAADSSGNIGITWGDGRKYKFGNASGVYTPPPGIHEKLIVNGSNPVASYDIIEKDQTKYHFANYGGTYVLNTITDENGNQITVNNSSNGGLISITDSSNRTVTFGYNGPTAGTYNTMTDPLGHVVSLSYDASRNLSQVTYPTLNGTSYRVTLGYDANHNITSIQDKRGNTSTFSYNSADNSLAWAKDNLSNQTIFTYGSPYSYDTTITDANGHNTIHAYTNGRLSQISDALGYNEYYTYDSDNNVTQKQDRRGYSWSATYDGMGNVLTATPPGGSASVMTYNAHNRLLTAKLPSGRSVAITYDGLDNLTQVQQKDASGNVKATTTCAIGSYGLVASKTDANGHKTLYTYDYNGDLQSMTTPLGHETKWVYDILGFQTERIDAMGRPTTYTPDAWERLVTTTYPDSTTHTFAYDPNGNLTNWADAVTGSWFRAYDADNRMTSEYNGSTRLVSHAYDAAGQKGLRSSTTDYYGRVISYAYSARNELAGVSEAAGTETYAYDPDGHQTHRYLPNGLRTDQYYNPDGTLDSYYNWDGAGTIYQSYGYGYNADHQMTGYNAGTSNNVHVTANPTNDAYGYDSLGHLTSETRTGSYPYAKTYTVDGVGNRTYMNENGAVNTLFYDADDALQGSRESAIAYTYNANGDQVTSTLNGQVTTYAYDYDDQLVRLTKPGSAVTFTYDGLGRQCQRVVNGVYDNSYYDDGGQMLFEAGASGELAAYTWGNGLVRRTGEYPLTDGQGTTKLETNSSQAVTSTQETEAFGRSIGGTGSPVSPYGYHGAEGYRSDGDGPAGLEPYQKVGARYYDATFGRFITRDTELSQAPYAYCDGDPVNFSDPTGHHKKKGPPKPGQGNSAPPSGPGGAGGEKPGQGLIEGGDNVAAAGAVVGGVGLGIQKAGPAGGAVGGTIVEIGVGIAAVGGGMHLLGVALNNGLNLFGPSHSEPYAPKPPTNSLGQLLLE